MNYSLHVYALFIKKSSSLCPTMLICLMCTHY